MILTLKATTTYKQALRGLFVTGTSPGFMPTREKVVDEPGLKTQKK